MDDAALLGLIGTAAFLGFFHTVIGPDHSLPFVAMSKIGRWSLTRTLIVTFLSGIGHVLSSVVLGCLGIAAGLVVSKLEWFEGVRGDLASWLLLAFGLVYMVWGIRRAIRNRPHRHRHVHADGDVHEHVHTHHADHAHPHVAADAADERTTARMTPWIIFTIFVFGPCEPLIPILMYPALRHSTWGVALVATVFAICTIGTMLTIVTVGYYGLLKLSSSRLERYAHAIAGFALAACGGAMVAGL
jgi:ABC-type nickel/cobalt efflux system permease component RcnA